MNKRAVLLDIDGTLVDSTYFHAVAWWRACRAAGETVPMFRLHRLVGMGADTLTKTLFGKDRPELGEAEGREYAAFMGEPVPLPGAPDLIRRISEAGLSAVLASSSREKDIPRLLEVIGEQEAIVAVTSSADAERTKPHPDIFQAALEKAGAEPEHCIAVGDTGWDIEAAGKLGIDTIGLLCGGWSEAELKDAGAVEVYTDPSELVEHFDNSAIARQLLRADT